MNWIALESVSAFEKLLSDADKKDEVRAIFKHSTRCAVSSMAKYRIQKHWEKLAAGVPLYYVDLIRFRDLSNRIAGELNVEHESPQLILLKGDRVIYHASHTAIDVQEMLNYK